MSATSEANTLFKLAVSNPADEITRLVFADWLEDTGTADNSAWASYIRLGTVTHQGAMHRQERADRRAIAGRSVVAKLSVSLPEFWLHSLGLLHLLPAANITVRLAETIIPLAIVAQVWDWTARSRMMLPIEWSGWHPNGTKKPWTERTLIIATVDPARMQQSNAYTPYREQSWAEHYVRAEATDLAAAIDRSYSQLREASAVRSLLMGFPAESHVDGPSSFGILDVPPIVRLVQGILADAIHRQARLIRMSPRSEGSVISMRYQTYWRDWNFVPWWLQNDVIAELRRMAGLIPMPEVIRDVEIGLVEYRHHDELYELPIELTNTPTGPNVTITMTEPVG